MGFGGCLAAVLGFGRATGAGFVGAWPFAAAGLLVMETGLRARSGGFPCGLGGGVLDEDLWWWRMRWLWWWRLSSRRRRRELWGMAAGLGRRWWASDAGACGQ